MHISSALNFGGGERHLVDLVRGLGEGGHDVFVALRPTNQWQSNMDFLAKDRILHVSVRNSFGMFSAKRIAKFVEENRIDILHAHVARDYLAASLAARISKNTKLVLTRHVVFPMKPFHRFALRNVDAAIAVSPAVARQLEKIFHRSKVRHIPNGISLGSRVQEDRAGLGETFRGDHGIALEAPLVVTLGELKVLKGQRDFVLAANEVIKVIPEARFVVAGKDNSLDQKFRRELKRLVRVFGIEENFLWLDWLDDTAPLLAAADLFVSPSHSESFGLAILEAMAAGTPVLATETDGARELIDQADALTPIKDPLTLAGKIVSLLQNKERRIEISKALENTARGRFGVESMISSTAELYGELIRTHPQN
jgi:glycosyltransferase involved in cell wall biosynthesis